MKQWKRLGLIFAIITAMFTCPMNTEAHSQATQEDVYTWYKAHEQTGGTLQLHQDLVFSRSDDCIWFTNEYDKSFTIDMQGHNIIIDNRHYVMFRKGFTFQNVGQIIIEEGSELDGENLVIESNSAKPALVIKGKYLIQNSVINNVQGIGIADERDPANIEEGFEILTLINMEIHAKTALTTSQRVEAYNCYLDGYVRASSILQDTSIIHESSVTPEIVTRRAFYDENNSVTSTYYLPYRKGMEITSGYLPEKANIYPKRDAQDSMWCAPLPITLSYDTTKVNSDGFVNGRYTLRAHITMTPFLEKLIAQGMLDMSDLQAPNVELKLVDSYQLLAYATNRFGLYLEVEMMPALLAESVQFAISEDGNTWYYSDDLAQEFYRYSEKEEARYDNPVYASSIRFYQDDKHEVYFQLKRNKTYELRFEIKGGMYDGVYLATKLSTYAHDLDSDFIYTIHLKDLSHEVEVVVPSEKPDPNHDGSIDGNRGGGGQREGKRDVDEQDAWKQAKDQKVGGSEHPSDVDDKQANTEEALVKDKITIARTGSKIMVFIIPTGIIVLVACIAYGRYRKGKRGRH